MKFSFELDFGKATKAAAAPITSEPTPMEKREAFNPTQTPYDPGVPLPGYLDNIPQKEPIGTSVPPGYNYTWANTKKPGLSLLACRGLADACYGIRLTIESLKRQMRSLEWNIGKKGSTGNDTTAEGIRRLLMRPDGIHLFSDWLGSVMEEVLVPGVLAVAPLERYNGEKAGLRVIDAATLTPCWTSTGQIPQPPFEAYQQVILGTKMRSYTADQLIYRPFSLRSWTPYGMSPVEMTYSIIMLMLGRVSYYGNWLENGNVPPAFLKMPDEYISSVTANGKTKGEMWEAALSARMVDPDKRHQMKSIPESFKFEASRDNFDWMYEFDEYLMRIFAWAVGVNPVWVIKTSSLGQGSEGLSETAIQEGMKPYQIFIKELLDDYIAVELGLPNYQFLWTEEVDHNKNGKLEEDDRFIRNGVRSRDEVRIERGLKPIGKPGFTEPNIMTATGIVAVTENTPAPEGGMLLPFSKAQGADLEKWERKAKNSFKAGNGAAVDFKSDNIAPKVAEIVTRALKVSFSSGAIDKAFKAAKKGKRFVRPDYDNMPLVKHGEKLWTPILKKLVEKYLAQNVGAQKAEPKDYGVEDWENIVNWLEDLLTMGAGITSADIKTLGIKAIAEKRAAVLIGKHWDGTAWTDSKVPGMAIEDDLRTQLQNILDPMITNGASHGEMTDAVWKAFEDEGGIAARASRIARTEAAIGYNLGCLAGWKSTGVTHVIVHDGDDADACEECAAVNGQIWSVEEAAENPIEHPNCVRGFEDIPADEMDTHNGEIEEGD